MEKLILKTKYKDLKPRTYTVDVTDRPDRFILKWNGQDYILDKSEADFDILEVDSTLKQYYEERDKENRSEQPES